MITLKDVQKHAEALGLRIVEDHIYDETGQRTEEGYWIETVDRMPAWRDENFSTSLVEVAGKLTAHEIDKHGTCA